MDAVRETIVHLMGMGRFLDVQVSAFEDGDARAGGDRAGAAPRVAAHRVHRRTRACPKARCASSSPSASAPSPPYGRAADIARALEELLADHGLPPGEGRRPRAGRGRGGRRPRVPRDERRQGRGADRVVPGRRPRGRPGHPGAGAAARPVRSSIASSSAAGSTLSPSDGGRGATTRPGPTPRVEESETGATVDVTITFVRGPLVTVSVKDNALTPKQLAEFVPAEREGSVDEDLLEDSEARIEEHLRAQGYRDADASYERIADGDQLRIVFTVKYGPLYRVADVRFEGAARGDARRPRAADEPGRGPARSCRRVSTPTCGRCSPRTGGAGSATCRAGRAVEPVPGRADLTARPRSSSSCGSPRGRAPSSRPWTWRATRAVPKAELETGLATRAGGPLFEPDVEADRDRILVRYLNLGYRLARVDASVSVSADRTGARVRFAIDEGPQVLVDHVLVVGNDRIGGGDDPARAAAQAGRAAGPRGDRGEPAQAGRPGRLPARDDLRAAARGRRPPRRPRDGGGIAGHDARLRRRRGVPEGRDRRVRAARVLRDRPPEPLGQEPVDQPVQPRQPPAPLLHRRWRRRREEATSSSTTVEYRVIGAYREPKFAGTSADLQVAVGFEQGSRTSFSFRSETAAREPLPALSAPRGACRASTSSSATTSSRIASTHRPAADRPPVPAGAHRIGVGERASAARATTPFNPKRGHAGRAQRRTGAAADRVGGRVRQDVPAGVLLPAAAVEPADRPRRRRAPGPRHRVSARRAAHDPGRRPDSRPGRRAADRRRCATCRRANATSPAATRRSAGSHSIGVGEPDTFDRDGTPIGGHAEIILNGEVRLSLWKDLGARRVPRRRQRVLDRRTTCRSDTCGPAPASVSATTRRSARSDSTSGSSSGTLRTYGPEREDRFALHISIGQAF